MKYFKTDGIRGELFSSLSSDFVYKLGRSINVIPFEKVLIGYDTRESSTLLKNAISIGLIEANKEIIDVGVISTGGLLYLSKKYDCLGIMITASHNKCSDNGIKIFLSGEKINRELKEKIESDIDNGLFKHYGIGKYSFLDLGKEYEEYLFSRTKKYPYRIGLDFANGSLYKIGKKVFSRISDHLFYCGDKPNGKNTNDNCGSTYIDSIRRLVLCNECDIGFSFDGDGDRLVTVDSKGNVYDGTALLFVLAKYLKKHNKLKNNGVVVTEVTNIGVINSFKKEGIDVYVSKVGDQNVFEMMKEYDLILGGEESGHIINLDSFFVGEGITNALYILSLLEEEKKDIKELTYNLDYTYEIRTTIKTSSDDIINNEKIKEYIQNIENDNKDKIKIVLRKSGTEEVVRLFISSYDNSLMNEVKKNIVNMINIVDIDFMQKVQCFDLKKSSDDYIFVDQEAIIEEGVKILPFTIIKGKSIINKGSVIGPYSEVDNSIIGEKSVIKHSIVSCSTIGNDVEIGPFAHIHNNSILDNGVVIGNYVEVKKSSIGSKTKAKHLSYLGDTVCGRNVNIGCGSITVNYDGKEKHKTNIGDNAFIGCNSNLIAPINIGDDSFIAAGSSITENVPSNSFSIARNRQIIKENYVKKDRREK